MDKEELARPSVTLYLRIKGYTRLDWCLPLYGLLVFKILKLLHFCALIIGAAGLGLKVMTANKKIILTQGGPAILALLSILLLG